MVSLFVSFEKQREVSPLLFMDKDSFLIRALMGF